MATFYQTLLNELKEFHVILKISLYISSIWDLDFQQLTGIIHSFCISHKLWDCDVLLLNFISVLFPLCLMVLTYTLIELHARDFRIVVCCWKPFHSCCVRVRRNWSAFDSIIHAYASLLLLSFATLNYNAFELLRSTNVYSANRVEKENVLINHPDIHVFTRKYVYYCVVVLLLLFLLGVCPSVLLLLYPIQLFRRNLQRFLSQRWLIRLNIFVETFLGSFKDGCNGSHNFRIIPGLVACLVLFLNVLGCLAHVVQYNVYLILTFVACFALFAVLCAYACPCKSSLINLSLTFHFMWIAALGFLMTLWWQDLDMDSTVLASLFAICVPFPHTLMFMWVLYEVDKKVIH